MLRELIKVVLGCELDLLLCHCMTLHNACMHLLYHCMTYTMHACIPESCVLCFSMQRLGNRTDP